MLSDPPYPDLHFPTEVLVLSRERGEVCSLNLCVRECFLREAQLEGRVPTSYPFITGHNSHLHQ